LRGRRRLPGLVPPLHGRRQRGGGVRARRRGRERHGGRHRLLHRLPAAAGRSRRAMVDRMSAAARSLARVAAMVAAVGVTAASAQASVTVTVLERPSPTVTLRRAGAAPVDADSVVTVAGSQPVELEVVLDTKLSTLEGYRYALRWSGGALSALGLEHVEGAVAPLEPDAFGPFEIDEP